MNQKTVGHKEKAKQGAGEFTVLPNGRVRWRGSVTTYTGEQVRVSRTAANMTEARGCQEAFRNSEEDFDFNVKNRLTH